MEDLLLWKQSRTSYQMTLLRLFSVVLIFSLLIVPVGASAAPAARNNSAFQTGQLPMLTPVKSGVTVTPLLTVGDVLPNGYRFEAIPDGISFRKSKGSAEIFVNHETSKVPFPYNPSVAVTDPAESQNDFDNAQVSRLVLDKKTAGVLDGSILLSSSEGFQRFCSNFLVTSKEGFKHDVLFTNEEAIDYVLRQEDSWPPQLTDPNQKQIGVVVALDLVTGQSHPIYGLGRFNHENSVPVPQFKKKVVLLSGDDTFTTGPLTGVTFPPDVTVPAQSQLYSYIASKADDVLNDKGDLWAFVSDDPNFSDYYDFIPGSTVSVSGHFVKVPKNIATGLNPDGSEIKSIDVGFPAPPNNGSWQRDNRTAVATGYDGPQWVLEYWSDINHVFQFTRVEDIAFDKRSGMSNVVYIVDSGRGSSGQGTGISTNVRVWKMVFDQNNPTIVTSLSVFVEGDDNPVKTLNEIHQPDNLETTAAGLFITEDPGSSQQFPVGSTDANATTARVWYVPFSGAPEVVAKVDQGADEGPTDVDPADNPPFAPAAFPISPGNWGAWETSGIIDVSDVFGPGAFLITVQAHTLWVESAPGLDTFVDADTNPDFTFKREGGQLLLLRIPGL